jgi:hypothetical protein
MGLAPVLADTIGAALVRAYETNPQLNGQCAKRFSILAFVSPLALASYCSSSLRFASLRDRVRFSFPRALLAAPSPAFRSARLQNPTAIVV